MLTYAQPMAASGIRTNTIRALVFLLLAPMLVVSVPDRALAEGQPGPHLCAGGPTSTEADLADSYDRVTVCVPDAKVCDAWIRVELSKSPTIQCWSRALGVEPHKHGYLRYLIHSTFSVEGQLLSETYKTEYVDPADLAPERAIVGDDGHTYYMPAILRSPYAGRIYQATTVAELSFARDFDDECSTRLRLYRVFFNREPDLAGAKFWCGRPIQQTLSEAIAFFAISPEFKERYGESVSDEQFVAHLYTNVFGRDYDQAGYEFWIDQIATGQRDRVNVATFFAQSEEMVIRVPYPSIVIPTNQGLFPKPTTSAVQYEDPIVWANQ